jgi:hypothetical protein
MHTDFLCTLYFPTLALHVSGAICTHHQKHKLTVLKCDGVPAATYFNELSNSQHTTTITRTYGCTLRFVLLVMGAHSTRNMLSKYKKVKVKVTL